MPGELCGPDLARMVNEFEISVKTDDTNQTQRPHHEENQVFQERFHDDVQKAISAMECNPFEMNKLTAINNKHFF